MCDVINYRIDSSNQKKRYLPQGSCFEDFIKATSLAYAIIHPGSCAMSIFYLSLMGLLMIANMAMSQEQLAEQPAEQQFCPRASAENPRCISHRYEIREIRLKIFHTPVRFRFSDKPNCTSLILQTFLFLGLVGIFDCILVIS